MSDFGTNYSYAKAVFNWFIKDIIISVLHHHVARVLSVEN